MSGNCLKEYTATDTIPYECKPVQIIDISPNKPKTSGGNNEDRIIFKGRELSEILSKVGGKEVELLTIAGPSRFGKSFILSYMLKYLQKLSSKSLDSEWMGQNEPLPKTFPWRSGKERETIGIWMWPEPFTLTKPDGSEFAVLLVDTQGVFDSYTEQKDWATIVGLSLLTSSCLILNIIHSIQEDTLNALKDFMDFGLMASDAGEDSHQKAFQKLFFLVRDWQHLDDHPYGAQGGAEYVKWILEQQNIEAGIRIRAQMKDCFDKMDGFLMPGPGDDVRSKDYDGSVAKMDPKFARNIQHCIEHLFNPSLFSRKKICGDYLTGDKLFLYFEQYVKVFNSSQMPTAEDMNQANMIVFNQIVVKKCLEIYESEMKTRRQSRQFLFYNELTNAHEASKITSLEAFRTSRKIGTPENVTKYKMDLEEKIKESFKTISENNARDRSDSVKAHVQNLEAYYIENMADEIKKTCTGPDNFITDKSFELTSQECHQSTLQKLQEDLFFDSLNLLTSDEEQLLNDALKSLNSTLCTTNQLNMAIAKQAMLTFVPEMAADFSCKLKNEIKKFKYWTEDALAQTESQLRIEFLEKFSSEYSMSLLFKDGKLSLLESINKEFENLRETIISQNLNFVMVCKESLFHLAKAYTERMDKSILLEQSINLGATHTHNTQGALSDLRKTIDFDRLPSTEVHSLEAELNSEIRSCYDQLVERWSPIKRQNLLRKYKDATAKFCGPIQSIKVLKAEDIRERHTVEKAKAVQELLDFISLTTVEEETAGAGAGLSMEKDDFLELFKKDMDDHIETIIFHNTARTQALLPTLDGYMSSARLKYFELAHLINQKCLDKDTFTREINAARKNVTDSFETKCRSLLGDIPLEDSLTSLNDFMKSVTQIRKESGTGGILEVIGSDLHLSKELETVENLDDERIQGIFEVRFISSSKITLDENVCGEFWAGKNLVLYSPDIFVRGRERTMDVSGRNGASTSSDPPLTPHQPGTTGLNGEDGKVGECGGNILIEATRIHSHKNLKLISNGGNGGSGQPGGHGSDGATAGVDGNMRYTMSMAKLKQMFPSPAKFRGSASSEMIAEGDKSAQQLQSEGGRYKKLKAVGIWQSRCWEIAMEEGAIFRYAFHETISSSRYFYMWFKGAPGSSGQRGGLGGLGGRGGAPGASGTNTVVTSNKVVIDTKRLGGASGNTATKGNDGARRLNGKQGTDYAYIDPYSGITSIASNFTSITEFSGNLEMYTVDDGFYNRYVSWGNDFDYSAYCPEKEAYISFRSTTVTRPALNLNVPQEPGKPLKQEILKKPQGNEPISEQHIKSSYAHIMYSSGSGMPEEVSDSISTSSAAISPSLPSEIPARAQEEQEEEEQQQPPSQCVLA